MALVDQGHIDDVRDNQSLAKLGALFSASNSLLEKKSIELKKNDKSALMALE